MNKYEYTQAFKDLWKMYPKRSGSNPKRKAHKAYNARLKEGATHNEILLGVGKYHHFCDETEKIGTEYVLQAATFFGPDCHFENEWELPKKDTGQFFKGTYKEPEQRTTEQLEKDRAAGAIALQEMRRK